MQEACTIIQSAAHEDANIIFGAVLDDKTKDAVKITVIATGFRDEDRPRRQQETSSAFIVSREREEDDFFREEEIESEPEPSRPIVMQETASVQQAAQSEPSLDSMRSAMIANFEQSDLDVPAFLRKRAETM